MKTPDSTPSASPTRAARRSARQRGWVWTALEGLRHWLRSSGSRRSEWPEDKSSSRLASPSVRVVQDFPDGSRVEFDSGQFDQWCVYVTRPAQPRHAPRDVQYFAELQRLHAQCPHLHADFIEVFERTTGHVEAVVLARISELAASYSDSQGTDVAVLLTTLYAAMIAEENRAHAPLGKRINRLGIHQVLIEGMPVDEAANFSRGQPWRELEKLCRARGF